MATASQIVYNHDIVGVWDRLNRFIEETQKAVSANVSLTNEFDIARLTTYLDAVDRYLAWIVAQPQLDLPETSPREYALEPGPEPIPVENEDMDDLLRLLRLARDEVVNSQSARFGSGLMPPDQKRLTATIAKARAFLKDYIVPTQPLDLPESSPAKLMSGSGKTGV